MGVHNSCANLILVSKFYFTLIRFEIVVIKRNLFNANGQTSDYEIIEWMSSTEFMVQKLLPIEFNASRFQW